MKVVNRIKANEDFALAIKNGKSLKSNSFTIYCYKSEYNRIRIGISVSKKIGNAVVRNRIKRQLRAMCDMIFDYNSNSFDIVVIVRNGFLGRNFWENKEMLLKLINEAQIGVAK